jgi:hypothetical protein
MAATNGAGPDLTAINLPSFEGGEDAESILVNAMVRTVALPVEVLDWAFMCEQYCSVGGYGRRLADRYIDLWARSSTGLFRRLIDGLEAIALKKFLPRLPGMPGGGMGGFGK